MTCGHHQFCSELCVLLIFNPEIATHSSILPGEFHGQRSLVGYSPWDRILRRARVGPMTVLEANPLQIQKDRCTHSSTLALKIPWAEELGAGYYPWGRKELGTTERLHFHFY